MTNQGRRLTSVVAALLLVLSVAAIATGPAAVAAEDDIAVRITGVSPTELRTGAKVTLSGTVTNGGTKPWTKAQAYLVIPQTPFTTRQQVTEAVNSDAVYTGQRVVELNSIDEIGTLAPGETRPFRVRVPYGQLNVTGAEGVYPVGVQILATAPDGTRSNTAVGRATTFIPLLQGKQDSVPAGLVWPFVLPDRLDGSGRYPSAADLVGRVSPRGQLRNLLDHARAAPPSGTSVLIDPALLNVLDDLANGRRLPDDVTLTAADQRAVQSFLTDLVALSQRATTWSLGYARPDVNAIAAARNSAALAAAIDLATSQTLSHHELTGRRVSWPLGGALSSGVLPQVRDGGESAVIVSRTSVPDWEPRLGSVVMRRTKDGPVPLLVNAGLDVGVPGTKSIATLRQRLVSEAAFASLERTSDPTSHADALVLLEPTWDPGSTTVDSLAAALEPDFVQPTDLEALLASDRAVYTGSIPRSATPVVTTEQVSATEELTRVGAVLAELAVDPGMRATERARTVAALLSVAWKDDPEGGAAAARAQAARAKRELAQLSVEGPPAFTLSSSEGSFPLTLRNDTDTTVRVGVRIDASNPALSIPDVEPVEVEAGARRTVNVTVDVGEQTFSTFTAQLTTEGGAVIGQPDSFNVRSSHVGVALWVAMGAAGLFVLFALGRRFLRGRGGRDVERGEPDE